jgi:hypothetical protein
MSAFIKKFLLLILASLQLFSFGLPEIFSMLRGKEILNPGLKIHSMSVRLLMRSGTHILVNQL